MHILLWRAARDMTTAVKCAVPCPGRTTSPPAFLLVKAAGPARLSKARKGVKTTPPGLITNIYIYTYIKKYMYIIIIMYMQCIQL